ncbi:hypothetical protein [Halosegnis marinus]|uniref:MarR family transcriptional regulator n=1 Tax=Halosegnis marinus TaxID=3034023 RepID=A0ABD5ZT49_9EURY|nr:hypothetical protein [Halosegnis sp. DT85]
MEGEAAPELDAVERAVLWTLANNPVGLSVHSLAAATPTDGPVAPTVRALAESGLLRCVDAGHRRYRVTPAGYERVAPAE